MHMVLHARPARAQFFLHGFDADDIHAAAFKQALNIDALQHRGRATHIYALVAIAFGRRYIFENRTHDAAYLAPGSILHAIRRASSKGSRRALTLRSNSGGRNGLARQSSAPSLPARSRKPFGSMRPPPEIARIGMFGKRCFTSMIVSMPSRLGITISVMIMVGCACSITLRPILPSRASTTA